MQYKLTVCIGVLNQFPISLKALCMLMELADNKNEIDFIIIDNGSKTRFADYIDEHFSPELREQLTNVRVVGVEEPAGCYPGLFKIGLEHALSPVIAFLHSDVLVYEQGWDTHVLAQFNANENLGLMGFIGSTQIDGFGGRGLGTHSNMQGHEIEQNSGYDVNLCLNCNKFENDHAAGATECSSFIPKGSGIVWKGSEAEVHGKRDEGFIIDGAVIDGCVMIFRKEALEKIGFKKNYPPHHFYDRAMSVQILEAGYKVGILGVAFDHISGQTVNQEQTFHDFAKDWAFEKLGITEPEQWFDLPENAEWVKNATNPSKGHVPHGWDHVLYLSAEKLFLEEYRDQKHIIPVNC